MPRTAGSITPRFATRSLFIAGQRRNRTNASISDAAAYKSLDSILIANRGEIALRVNRTAAKHGIRTTTLYTNPDATAQHALSTPFSFNLGDTSAYLDGAKIIDIARKQGCQAIHPGYGFLSENAAFARQCTENGLIFIGPPWKAIEDMGDKAKSKEIMTKAGVPCVPGYHGQDQDPQFLAQEAENIKYPVLIKAVRGGGGKGMRIVHSSSEFMDMLESAKREARNSFGNDEVLIEKYITTPRHIEVQVFADKHGNCVALGERDCSIQRRHQKILEESPAPNLDIATRKDIWEKARAAALAVGYEGAGTVEFIFDNDTSEFFFMEMNTRLQVEHPVTEMVTGQDLVHWQILVAEGKPLPLTQDEVEAEIAKRGHAIEARIYAENPNKGFIPDSGKLLHVRLPQETSDVRIDSGFVEGDVVSAHYDPMISKLIVRGENRYEAVRNLAMALESYEIAGPVTNIEFLKRVCRSQDFADGHVETGYIKKHETELFENKEIENEVLAQAAIASYLHASPPQTSHPTQAPLSSEPSWLSPDRDFEPRRFSFIDASIEPDPTAEPQPYTIDIRQVRPGHFEVSIPDASPEFQNILTTSHYDPSKREIITFFPHTRLTSTIIFPSTSSSSSSSSFSPSQTTNTPITLFTSTRLHLLLPPPPPFLLKTLSASAATTAKSTVLSPMPCKILRVDVKAGDVVKQGQSLLVIESMKMETVIRSPKEGIVKRVVCGEGEVCGSGVRLVEFEEEEGQEEGK